MSEYIYRYVSFSSFVNMIQTQSLNFVLPITWEDVRENAFLQTWIDNQEKDISRLYTEILAERTFAQSWTLLSESDAMWRIYNYENQSLRIKVSKDIISMLDGVYVEPVIYCDTNIDYTNSGLVKKEIFLKLIAQKRIAFSHEQEVRLIYVDVPEIEKLKESMQSMFIVSDILNEKPTTVEVKDLRDLIDKLDYLNINHNITNHTISFSHLKNFISGVLVNPFAPSWYVDTIKKYCEINGIPFEGKSTLYEGVKNE